MNITRSKTSYSRLTVVVGQHCSLIIFYKKGQQYITGSETILLYPLDKPSNSFVLLGCGKNHNKKHPLLAQARGSIYIRTECTAGIVAKFGCFDSELLYSVDCLRIRPIDCSVACAPARLIYSVLFMAGRFINNGNQLLNSLFKDLRDIL